MLSKAQILTPNYNLKSSSWYTIFKKYPKSCDFEFFGTNPNPNFSKILNPQESCSARIPLVAF